MNDSLGIGSCEDCLPVYSPCRYRATVDAGNDDPRISLLTQFGLLTLEICGLGSIDEFLCELQRLIRTLCCTRRSISGLFVGVVHQSGEDGVDNEKSEADEFRDKFRDIPFIAISLTGYAVAWAGWLNLHFRRPGAPGIVCLVVDILIVSFGRVDVRQEEFLVSRV
jgi:hypothetical protein